MEKILLGYVGADTPVSRGDAEKLTHIHAAFGKLLPDGSVQIGSHGILGQMDRLRRWNPGLRICVSIVNGEPRAFTTVCREPALREAFARSCRELVESGGFDGVDLDWEYPCVTTNGSDASPDDRENFTLALRAVRRELDRLPGRATLSIAAAAEPFYTRCVDLPAAARCLDYLCLMTYDLKGNPHAVAGHHTALFETTGDVFPNSCAGALELFCRQGVPREKLLMGAAFYSRKWVEVPDRYHGLLQLSPPGGRLRPGLRGAQGEFPGERGALPTTGTTRPKPPTCSTAAPSSALTTPVPWGKSAGMCSGRGTGACSTGTMGATPPGSCWTPCGRACKAA